MQPYNDITSDSGTASLRIVVETIPTALLVGVAALLAWREHGSVAVRDWAGWGAGIVLLLAVLLAAGAVRRPGRLELAAVGGLAALAAWAALSLTWAPLPALARDEALLTLLYAATLAVPMLTLRSREARLAALAVLVLVLGAMAVATAAQLRFGDDQLAAYAGSGRLYFPVSYVNAQAAFVLLAFWPAVALGARRASPVLLRAAALGAAAGVLAVAALTQSRGAAVALALSTVLVLAAIPARLRLAVAALVPVVPAGLLFQRLTEPYRARGDAALEDAIRSAGGSALLVAALGAALGLAYALADGRLRLRARTVELAGRAAALFVVALLAGGATAVLASVDEPGDELAARWAAFKREPTSYDTDTHFLAPGSNRYDFWRVALLEARDHPLAGAGARSFGPAYLVRGDDTGETPARSHSLPLDVLAETGVVGLAALLVALGAAVAGLLRRRARVPAAAAFAGATYWLLHAAVDWTWTFPASGIPFFALLGIGLARGGAALAGRRAAVAGAAVALVGAAAFAPPWLAQRYLQQGAAQGLPAGRDDLDRARALDPLLTDPLLVEAQLVPPAEAVPLLRRAAAEEPRSVRNQYLLGLGLLEAGRREEARRVLLRARALYPASEAIAAALTRTR